MKNWSRPWATFKNRLWYQLAISYSLMAFGSMIAIVVMLYGLDDYGDFRKTVTVENVKRQLQLEELTVAQSIQDPENIEWRNKTRDSIRERLINLDHSNGVAVYRVTNSSHPEVYLQIVDLKGHVLASDPDVLPEEIHAQFEKQKVPPLSESRVTELQENEHIWADIPISNSSGEAVGRLRVLYIAEFNLWIQIKTVIDFLLSYWLSVTLMSVPIGIICGLIASRYLTRQLQKMNEVTANWRQGNFESRIKLPKDDVLTKHSQYLNSMADDLESFMSLKQNIAISDERTRLARELHDTVKQKLFALGLQLATAKSKPGVMEAAKEHILEAESIAREAQQDLMEIITQLRPTGTSETSLFERISLIAMNFKRRFNIAIEIIHAESISCSANTEHHLQRIVQEALINAVRHGQASEILISSKIKQGIVTFSIHDNGSGFDVETYTPGIGIKSMRERTQDLPNGIFKIESTSAEGTTITISWGNQ